MEDVRDYALNSSLSAASYADFNGIDTDNIRRVVDALTAFKQLTDIEQNNLQIAMKW